MQHWTLLALGIVAVAVGTGCATPYGEDDGAAQSQADTSLPSRSNATAAKTAAAPPASSATGASSAPASTGSSVDTTTAAAKSTSAPPPSSVAISWNRVSATAQYSLDVLPTGQAWVAPCIDVNTIDRGLGVTFAGECPSANDTAFTPAQLQDFRVCWTDDGDWTHAKCKTADWDGSASSITLTLAE